MPSERVVRIAGPEPSLTVYPQRGKQVVLGLGAAVFVVLDVVLRLSGGVVRPVVDVVTIVAFGLFGALWVRQVTSNVRLCGTPVTLPVNTLPFTADQLIRAPTPSRAPWGNG